MAHGAISVLRPTKLRKKEDIHIEISWQNLKEDLDVEGTKTLTLKIPVLTIRTSSLTFSKTKFCPHSVFVCFVRI